LKLSHQLMFVGLGQEERYFGEGKPQVSLFRTYRQFSVVANKHLIIRFITSFNQ
jgi:hypothetical protein